MRPAHLSRRAMLRGIGVSMALPWMESVSVWGGDSAAQAEPSGQAPVRLGVLFSGSGFHAGHWWAKGAGREMELGKVLEPLRDFRQKLLYVGGLYNAEALKGNIHSSQTGNMLLQRGSGDRIPGPGNSGRTRTSGNNFRQSAPRALVRGDLPY